MFVLSTLILRKQTQSVSTGGLIRRTWEQHSLYFTHIKSEEEQVATFIFLKDLGTQKLGV